MFFFERGPKGRVEKSLNKLGIERFSTRFARSNKKLGDLANYWEGRHEENCLVYSVGISGAGFGRLRVGSEKIYSKEKSSRACSGGDFLPRRVPDSEKVLQRVLLQKPLYFLAK